MQLFDSQFRLQQYMLRIIPKGNHHWTGGTVAAHKLDDLAEKFSERYDTDIKDAKRYQLRKKKVASSRFLVSQLPDGRYLWFLVATDGTGRIHEEETLRDARVTSERVIWNGEYILLKTNRPYFHGGGKHWSWWMLPTKEQEISAYIDHLAKEGDPRLKSYLAELQGRPLHSGVRSQLWKIYRRAHRILQACHPEMPWPGPDMGEPLPWVSKFVSAKKTTTATAPDDEILSAHASQSVEQLKTIKPVRRTRASLANDLWAAVALIQERQKESTQICLSK